MKIRTSFTAIALACIFTVLPAIAFAFSPDSVLSHDIAEADGTSGQDTGIGSGVKTDHIQDGAVTTGKIADGSVTDAKIAGPISASKISSTNLDADTLDGKHAAELATAIHTHSQSEVTGLEAELAGKANILHDHDTLYQQKYGKVAVVAQTGGDYQDPVSAANDSATWCGISAPSNPCLLKIMPGIYDIGNSVITLSPSIDMEGSGENVTIIRGAGGYGVSLHRGQVVEGHMGTNEIRSLTIENYGPGIYGTTMTGVANIAKLEHVTVRLTPPAGIFDATGVYASLPSFSVELSDVKIQIETGTNFVRNPYGVFIEFPSTSLELNNVAVSINGSNTQTSVGLKTNSVNSVKIRNSEIVVTAPGQGIATYRNYGSSIVTMTDTVVTAPWDGIQAGSNSFSVDNSSVSGGLTSITHVSPIVFVANSKLAGPISNGGGSGQIKCVGAYDSNYDPITCTNP